MFQEQVFDKAGEFWNAVSPSNSDLYNRDVTPILRGQLADPKMRLIPTVLRDTDRSRILWTKTRGTPKIEMGERIGISAATVYPGIDGVGRATQESLLRFIVAA